jgi:hypothetical protein
MWTLKFKTPKKIRCRVQEPTKHGSQNYYCDHPPIHYKEIQHALHRFNVKQVSVFFFKNINIGY